MCFFPNQSVRVSGRESMEWWHAAVVVVVVVDGKHGVVARCCPNWFPCFCVPRPTGSGGQITRPKRSFAWEAHLPAYTRDDNPGLLLLLFRWGGSIPSWSIPDFGRPNNWRSGPIQALVHPCQAIQLLRARQDFEITWDISEKVSSWVLEVHHSVWCEMPERGALWCFANPLC